MSEKIKIFWAHIRANMWLFIYMGCCVLTIKNKYPDGKEETIGVEIGKGSVWNDTWKTKRVFYRKTLMRRCDD